MLFRHGRILVITLLAALALAGCGYVFHKARYFQKFDAYTS